MSNLPDPSKPARKTVIHRAYLAPDKSFGNWTVHDLRKFVQDCDEQGIPDSQLLHRLQDEFSFAREGGPIVAERVTEVD